MSTNIGGHLTVGTGTVSMGSAGTQNLYTCTDCHQEATSDSFQAGAHGCPMRPASLDYLSVCPGGKRCGGHPDTSTPEWVAWKASNSLPKESVPRITCDAAKLGVRAALQWRAHADRIGLKMSVWAQQAIADKVGAEGGVVAEMIHRGKPYYIAVTPYGKISAHQGVTPREGMSGRIIDPA